LRLGRRHALLTDTASDLDLRFSVGLISPSPSAQPSLRLAEAAWQARYAPTASRVTALRSRSLRTSTSRPGPPGRVRPAAANDSHPGAQLSFSDHDGHRFRVFITNQSGRRIARFEQIHRQRAIVEDAIHCAKDSGLRNLPFRTLAPNAVWLELVLMGQDLIAWTQRLLAQLAEHRL
jgi:hypothetical protein